MSTESPGGPPDQPGGPQSPGGGPPGGSGGPPGGPQSPGGPPPAGSGGPPPPPPPPGPQSGPPPPGAGPGYAGPQSGPAPGYAGGPMVASSMGPAALQGAEFSGWWRRVGALIIDSIIITIGIIGLLVGGYLFISWWMGRDGETNGQTPGKQALGIRAIREDGQPWTFGTALLREFVIKGLLLTVAGSITFGLTTLVNFLWPLWDDKKQALHDKLATSYVVRA